MVLYEIIIIAIGLAMDAFAVSICKGFQMKKIYWGRAFLVAFSFGLFQTVMPLLGWLIGNVGWLLGDQVSDFITNIDHFIAFGLLGFIGGKMIYDSIKEKDELEGEEKFSFKELIILSIATSIDALAVGITFAVSGVDIFSSITIIGVITLIICLGGVLIGNLFGCKFKSKAEILGGVILILMGIKILLEHLGILPF